MTKKKLARTSNKASRERSISTGAALFTCPECSGPLFQDKDGPNGQLKCLVGHSFAPESLSEAHREALERAVLTTMRLLQERALVHQHLSDSKAKAGDSQMKQRFQECSEDAAKDVKLLREILERI